MKKNCHAILIAFLFSCIFPKTIYCQDNQNQAQYYNWFDELVGVENTELYNGIVYVEKYRTINSKTKFFNSPSFLQGSITYYGQKFYGLQIKYDVFEDQILLKLEDRLGGNTIQLFKNRITDFRIDGHEFIRIEEKLGKKLVISGFHEVAFEGPLFTLFIKHKKKDFDRKDRRSLYYEFINSKNGYLLWYNNSYAVIDSKKDVSTIFPELKREIDNFYSIARSLRNSDLDSFMKSLMKRVEILKSQTNNAITE
ncbi:MAG: hypothetical protein COA50_11180 [Flavobacteriaceae bacterium]|nr:MAG: hypothetical protein COA50_11180 [Flavobacteriaceae bacterium]